MLTKMQAIEYSVLRFNAFIKDRPENEVKELILQFNERLKDCKDSITRRGVQNDPMPDHEWMAQFTAKGCGLDMLCGDFLVNNAVGVDGMTRLGSASGHVSDATHLPNIADASQDFIVTNYFDGIIQPDKALREWRRLLKTGGILAIAVCDADRYLDNEMGPLQNNRRHHVYTVRTLPMYLTRYGFKVKFTEQKKDAARIQSVSYKV